MLKVDYVEGELVRSDIFRGYVLRNQIAHQAQKIAPSPLQLKIASALSRDNEYFSSCRPWILTTKDDIPAEIPTASSSRDWMMAWASPASMQRWRN